MNYNRQCRCRSRKCFNNHCKYAGTKINTKTPKVIEKGINNFEENIRSLSKGTYMVSVKNTRRGTEPGRSFKSYKFIFESALPKSYLSAIQLMLNDKRS